MSEKPLLYEDGRPVFFFRVQRTTDNQALWNIWRVFKGEISYAKFYGNKVVGKTAIVYVDNPEKIQQTFVYELIKKGLAQHGL